MKGGKRTTHEKSERERRKNRWNIFSDFQWNWHHDRKEFLKCPTLPPQIRKTNRYQTQIQCANKSHSLNINVEQIEYLTFFETFFSLSLRSMLETCSRLQNIKPIKLGTDMHIMWWTFAVGKIRSLPRLLASIFLLLFEHQPALIFYFGVVSYTHSVIPFFDNIPNNDTAHWKPYHANDSFVGIL